MFSFTFSFFPSPPETNIKRQVTQHDCLPSLPGKGDKGTEMLDGEEIHISYGADHSNQGRTNISCTGTTNTTKQPRKDHFHLYFLSPHLPQFQQSAGAPLSSLSGPPFKISLIFSNLQVPRYILSAL
jgi:hypothetical protein